MGGSFGRVPDVGWLKSVQTKAVEMGGSWGQLSAAFSGFTSLSTIVRGRYVEVFRVSVLVSFARVREGTLLGIHTVGEALLLILFSMRLVAIKG